MCHPITSPHPHPQKMRRRIKVLALKQPMGEQPCLSSLSSSRRAPDESGVKDTSNGAAAK